jgi:hypothetical protein
MAQARANTRRILGALGTSTTAGVCKGATQVSWPRPRLRSGDTTGTSKPGVAGSSPAGRAPPLSHGRLSQARRSGEAAKVGIPMPKTATNGGEIVVVAWLKQPGDPVNVGERRSLDRQGQHRDPIACPRRVGGDSRERGRRGGRGSPADRARAHTAGRRSPYDPLRAWW